MSERWSVEDGYPAEPIRLSLRQVRDRIRMKEEELAELRDIRTRQVIMCTRIGEEGVDEVAEFLGVHPGTIRDWIRSFKRRYE